MQSELDLEALPPVVAQLQRLEGADYYPKTGSVIGSMVACAFAADDAIASANVAKFTAVLGALSIDARDRVETCALYKQLLKRRFKTAVDRIKADSASTAGQRYDALKRLAAQFDLLAPEDRKSADFALSWLNPRLGLNPSLITMS